MELFNENLIDKNSAIPLYFQLYSYIEKLIKDGTYKEGDKLPPEEELVEALGISRPTIRQAYKELAAKGYVKRQRSRGTIVTRPKVFHKFLTELTTFHKELGSEGTVRTKVLKFEKCSNPEIAKILNTDDLICLIRLRYSNDIPIVYLETWLPYEPCRSLLRHDMEKESLYETLESIGHPVQTVRRHLKAEKATGIIADYLELDENEPIMFSKTLGKDPADRPVEYSIASYNGAYADFQIDLQLK